MVFFVFFFTCLVKGFKKTRLNWIMAGSDLCNAETSALIWYVILSTVNYFSSYEIYQLNVSSQHSIIRQLVLKQSHPCSAVTFFVFMCILWKSEIKSRSMRDFFFLCVAACAVVFKVFIIQKKGCLFITKNPPDFDHKGCMLWYKTTHHRCIIDDSFYQRFTQTFNKHSKQTIFGGWRLICYGIFFFLLTFKL